MNVRAVTYNRDTIGHKHPKQIWSPDYERALNSLYSILTFSLKEIFNKMGVITTKKVIFRLIFFLF